MAASAANNNYGRTSAVVTAQKVYRRQITTIWISTIDQISSSSFFGGQNGSTSQQFKKRKQHIKIWSK